MTTHVHTHVHAAYTFTSFGQGKGVLPAGVCNMHVSICVCSLVLESFDVSLKCYAIDGFIATLLWHSDENCRPTAGGRIVYTVVGSGWDSLTR
jgi:hypothetical protein